MRASIKWIDRNLALLIILTAAFALRVYGNGYGLPDQLNIDEVHLVSRAIKFGSGDLNPHFFFYPALYMYVLFGFYGVYFVIAHALGIFKSASDFGMQYFIDPTAFYLIARTLTAAIGAATVWVVYAACERFYNKRIAVAAAALLCAAPLHIDMSHYAVTDVPMTFLIMLSLYFAMKLAMEDGRRNYFLAGLFGGLAMAVKYTAALLIPSLILAHVFCWINSKDKKGIGGLFSFNVFMMGIILLAAFFAGAPYTLLDFKTFIGDVRIQNQLLENGWFGMENVRNMWVYSISVYLRQGMGLPLLAVSMAGVIFAALRKNKAGIVLLAFVVIFYLFHGRITKHVFIRYWVAIVPAMCVFAAAFIDWTVEKIKIPAVARDAFVLLAALGLMAAPVRSTIKAEALMRNKDTRTLAREWVEENIEPSAKIAVEFGGPQLKPTEASLMDKSRVARMFKYHIDAAVPFYAYRNRKPVQVEAESAKKFHLAALARTDKKYDLFQTFALAEYPLAEYRREGYLYLIVNSGIYDRYNSAPKNYSEAVKFYKMLEKESILVKEFPAEPKTRSGPEIKIYKIMQ